MTTTEPGRTSMVRLARRPGASALLYRLIESPGLVREVRELAPESLASLVREVEVEDAGELVAFAATAQIVAAFDEDLFADLLFRKASGSLACAGERALVHSAEELEEALRTLLVAS